MAAGQTRYTTPDRRPLTQHSEQPSTIDVPNLSFAIALNGRSRIGMPMNQHSWAVFIEPAGCVRYKESGRSIMYTQAQRPRIEVAQSASRT